MTNEQEFPDPRHQPGVSVAIVILAAGRSSRMSPDVGHKLLATFDGVPLARRVASRAIASRAKRVFAVTGYRRENIENCFAGLDITIAFNPDFASGMASSLVTGLDIPGAMDHDGALILLADMPAIAVEHLDQLIGAFEGSRGRSVVRASHEGVGGNPVILPRALYQQALALRGDRGARMLVETAHLEVVDVDIGKAAMIDVDTWEDLRRQGGVSGSTR